MIFKLRVFILIPFRSVMLSFRLFSTLFSFSSFSSLFSLFSLVSSFLFVSACALFLFCPTLQAESTVNSKYSITPNNSESANSKLANDCSNESNAKECNNRLNEILLNWDGNAKLNPADARLISSFLKTNLNQYLNDEKALKEINDDLNQGQDNPDLETVSLYKLDNDNIFITLPIFMGAYQGQSISFIFNKSNKELHIVRFDKYDPAEKKMNSTYEHSNYADWLDSMLIIHDRSHGYLYQCGSTEYYKFEYGKLKLYKQTQANCSEKELESISKNRMTPEEIKIITVYPKK